MTQSTESVTQYTPPASKRTLSKSDFKLARTCDAKLYFRENGYPDARDRDAYLQLLAEGGYMVEALAKAGFPEGIEVGYGRHLATDFAATFELLQLDDVTLFEGTLLAGRRQARVDILRKRGSHIDLIEVKAKSFDGAKHTASLADGRKGALRAAKKPFAILSDWAEKLEDITYQVLLLKEILPGVMVHPWLMLVDKSKRAQVDDIIDLFRLEWDTNADGSRRLRTARYIGDRSQLGALDLLTRVDVSEEVDMLREAVAAESARFEALLDAPLSAHGVQRGLKCSKCEFRHNDPHERSGFAECWGELAHVHPHVLDLYRIDLVKASDGSPMVESLLGEGRASLFDIPIDCLTKANGEVGSIATRQRRQIEHARTGQFYIGPDLRSKIENVAYPLHFIDFETTRLALPYHAGMRPYGLIAFQWSCHSVESPGADPVHREWLNTADVWPNRDCMQALREAIGDAGSILTWSAFEMSVIREIAPELLARHPEDRELFDWLSTLGPRIVDMHKWAENDFHHPGMRGRTSIKVVLDALWKSDAVMRVECERWSRISPTAQDDPYASLESVTIAGEEHDVREGTAAIRAYEQMMYGSGRLDPAAKQDWAGLLRQYCALDTLSMVLIFRNLARASIAA